MEAHLEVAGVFLDFDPGDDGGLGDHHLALPDEELQVDLRHRHLIPQREHVQHGVRVERQFAARQQLPEPEVLRAAGPGPAPDELGALRVAAVDVQVHGPLRDRHLATGAARVQDPDLHPPGGAPMDPVLAVERPAARRDREVCAADGEPKEAVAELHRIDEGVDVRLAGAEEVRGGGRVKGVLGLVRVPHDV